MFGKCPGVDGVRSPALVAATPKLESPAGIQLTGILASAVPQSTVGKVPIGMVLIGMVAGTLTDDRLPRDRPESDGRPSRRPTGQILSPESRNSLVGMRHQARPWHFD